MSESEKPALIILNGASCAGKSSLAKSLQEEFGTERPFMHLQMDAFWDMVPSSMSVGNFPNMKHVIVDSTEALLRRGHNVIMDIVCPSGFLREICARLSEFDPYLVGVKASDEVLSAREQARPDRTPGQAIRQAQTIHGDTDYDSEVYTTTLTSDEAAHFVHDAFLRRRNGFVAAPSLILPPPMPGA